MTKLKQTSIYIAIFVFFGFGSINQALACRCGPSDLQQLYDKSEEVVLANVLSCKPEERYETCRFEIEERFKGHAKNNSVTYESANSCQMVLNTKQTYLLFINNGFTDVCTRSHIPVMADDRRVETLRGYKSGKFKDLAQPWQFKQFETACKIRQFAFDNGERYSMSMTYSKADKGSAVFSITFTDGYTVERFSKEHDTAMLTVGKSKLPLVKEKVQVHGGQHVWYKASGNEAHKIFKLIDQTDKITIAFGKADHDKINISTTRFADAGKQMQTCFKSDIGKEFEQAAISH